MKLSYSASLALSNLARSKLRTWLTITGIVIGVAAVVLIVSIGNGLQANVQSQLSGFGADIITVSPGFSRAAGAFGGFRGGGGGDFFGGGQRQEGNLTTKDLQAIRISTNVKVATGTINGRETMTFGSESSNVQVRGVDVLTWSAFTTDTVAQGRGLTPSDSNAILVGSRIATSLFKRPLTPNAVVEIAGHTFRVAGILAASGTQGGDDNAVIMPIAQARQVIEGLTPDQFNTISVKVKDASTAIDTASELDRRLSIERHVTNQTKDFTVTAAQTIQQTISSVTSSISLFLAGIAAISLLVGAIGIANTMFMTVLERTRQIGVLKALGATSREITLLFLIESAILGITGGIIGLAISFAVAATISQINLGFPTAGARGGGAFLITPDLAIFALLFSAIIGMVAGYIPARQASRLKPVEALRYE
jgi:putative ABC transport system permease protein